MPTPVLYCRDPLRPKRVDEHFAAEAAAVRAAGGAVALVDHDALLAGEPDRAVASVPVDLAEAAWYRGWMVPTDRYAELADALARRGVRLRVPPGRYHAAHELPGWYRAFEAVTPASAWLPVTPGATVADEELAGLAARLPAGPGIVKDFVKSRKHEWHEACFVPDLADTLRLGRVVRRFLDLQGDDLAGGIVLRAFEPFDDPEVRVWWRDGSPELVTPHPDSARIRCPEPDLAAVRPAVEALGGGLVATDLARRTDGAWRVVEAGSGQVSDLHPDVDRAEFAALLTG